VYPDDMDNVPAPETVDTENVVFAPIVKVYPEEIDRVPAPETVDTENVVFAPIVKVYPEEIDRVPAPETVVIPVGKITDTSIVKVAPDTMFMAWIPLKAQSGNAE